MSKAAYGGWESRGEDIDRALWAIANRHHHFAPECLCGHYAGTNRGYTEHIMDVTMKALVEIGVIS